MTINYTHTEPSRSYCKRFYTWCVMANGLGNCSNTACYYGYDRIKANTTASGTIRCITHDESEVEKCRQITEK
jgi:hypothetical protein